MTRRQGWLRVVLAVSTVVGLPLLGAWSRRHRLPRCDLDGAPIVPIYAVEIVDADGGQHAFCCILCAEFWLSQPTRSAREVRVTDEVSGRAIEAEDAFFVKSLSITNQATGNRVHAFARRDDAERHAAARGGRLLVGAERPFAVDPAGQ